MYYYITHVYIIINLYVHACKEYQTDTIVLFISMYSYTRVTIIVAHLYDIIVCTRRIHTYRIYSRTCIEIYTHKAYVLYYGAWTCECVSIRVWVLSCTRETRHNTLSDGQQYNAFTTVVCVLNQSRVRVSECVSVYLYTIATAEDTRVLYHTFVTILWFITTGGQLGVSCCNKRFLLLFCIL